MKGNKKIISALNQLLAGELTAMDQYFIHSRMYQDWGLNKLFERIDHEFDDEKNHAAALIERILFLEGIPDLSKRAPLNIGKDVVSMLESDLALEYAVVKELRDVMALCEKEQDYGTRQVLQQMLDDTEIDHAYWLEKQLGLVKRLGLKNYLQSQL